MNVDHRTARAFYAELLRDKDRNGVYIRDRAPRISHSYDDSRYVVLTSPQSFKTQVLENFVQELKPDHTAINRLCTSENPWKRIFLNHASIYPPVNPIGLLGASQKATDDKKKRILDSIPLNSEQQILFDIALEMPGGIL